MKSLTTMKFINEITVVDPDTGADVAVEIWKDGFTGGIFGIDASFLDQVGEFYNPFNGYRDELPAPDPRHN